MAYDKVVDSAQLNAAMTATANAIREKAGNSDACPWDASTGFASLIAAIQAGGGESVLNAVIDRSITEISINVTTIGNRVFYECTSLVTVNAPMTTVIGEYVFYKDSALTTINAPMVNSIGSNAFYGCSKLTGLDFPVVTNIGNSAFGSCKGLTKLKFPMVTKIGTYVFESASNLVTIDFCKTTNSIGYYVFSGCSSLTALIFRAEKMTVLSDSGALNNTPIKSGTGYIYVPSALIDTYKAASKWSTFANQFRALEDYTVDGTIDGELDETKI